MNDLEFEVLDQLYFITPFAELLGQCGLEKDILLKVLQELMAKKWIKVFEGHIEILETQSNHIHEKFESLSFLASKAGLLAHNGK